MLYTNICVYIYISYTYHNTCSSFVDISSESEKPKEKPKTCIHLPITQGPPKQIPAPNAQRLSFIQGTIFFTCLALGQFGSKVL